jgi:hypothetical protein
VNYFLDLYHTCNAKTQLLASAEPALACLHHFLHCSSFDTDADFSTIGTEVSAHAAHEAERPNAHIQQLTMCGKITNFFDKLLERIIQN